MTLNSVTAALEAIKRIAMGSSSKESFYSDCRVIYKTLINIQEQQLIKSNDK